MKSRRRWKRGRTGGKEKEEESKEEEEEEVRVGSDVKEAVTFAGACNSG